MNRFARTRSLKWGSQPVAGRAQWSVGSIDDDGMRYGLTTHCLSASTMMIAPPIVKTQSSTTRTSRGRFGNMRPSGSFTARAPAAELRRPRVVRVLERAVELGREALELTRALGERAGKPPRNCVEQHHRR